ncbi:MAG TPA: DUF6036 family nucleotidyltransferase [Gemmatimonadaceae bacterium]|jgi:hypothetical protein|nr:DUF6036 family nucleotidyltransferase [Gemmatimonadaceae bacterium]
MATDLSRTQLEGALAALGTTCRDDTTILLGGSAALILTNALERGTNDGWLNGSVQSYVEVLPPDYDTRVKTLRPFGRLSVSLLGRRDVIVMKFFSDRPKDLRDLEQIAPTAAELAFTARELPRLAKIDPVKTTRMQTVLDAWPGTEAK